MHENLNELAMTNPMGKVTEDIIEQAENDLLGCIVYIEKSHDIDLSKEKTKVSTAKKEWKDMTIAEVAFSVSYLRSGLFQKYY